MAVMNYKMLDELIEPGYLVRAGRALVDPSRFILGISWLKLITGKLKQTDINLG